MPLPVISVVIATIDGREDHLSRCIRAFEDTAAGQYEMDLVIERNRPTCGWGWQKGAERISPRGEYVALICDDLEPQPGWAPPAMAALQHGVLPAPRVLNGHTGAPEFFPQWGIEWEDGTPAGMSCIPFITRELWDDHVQPMLTCHYFTDNWVTYRCAKAGFRPLVVRPYLFKHYWAGHKRGAGMDYDQRLRHDQSVFIEAVKMADNGRWTKPWPPMESA